VLQVEGAISISVPLQKEFSVMLVITRRSSDRISFPQIGVTVHFIRVQGGSAKVGIDAPRDIVIVRDELAEDPEAATLLRQQWLRLPKEVRHEIRNELHAVSVGIHLYREQLKAGVNDEAAETFALVQDSIRRIDENDVLNRPDANKPQSLPGTVLVVEDQENEREMLAGLLRLQGYAVVAVRNGTEALDYLGQHEDPTVVLVDMGMPSCNGGDMVRQLRADGRHGETRVFAISGSTPEENDLEIGAGGVDRWFRKPLNPQFLLEAI